MALRPKSARRRLARLFSRRPRLVRFIALALAGSLSLVSFLRREPRTQSFYGAYAARVRAAARSTFNAYAANCLGHDDYSPSTNVCRDWAGLGVTLLDAADTLLLLNLPAEYRTARRFAARRLRIPSNRRRSVSPFEVTIRALGGLLSTYEISGDALWRTRARELGDALLPAFDTPSGCPGNRAGLNGRRPDAASVTSGASAGSMQMEMRTLSAITGDPRFGKAGDRCEASLLKAMPDRGLVAGFFDPVVGNFVGPSVSIGGGTDSFVEMMLKTWIAGGKRDSKLREAFESSVEGVFSHTAVEVDGELVLASAPRWPKGERKVEPTMEHLSCFFPGALALAALHGLGGGVSGSRTTDYMPRARRLMRTCFRMSRSNPHGLASETVSFTPAGMRIGVGARSLLRPEIVESLWVMHTVTGGREPEYREWGRVMWESIEKNGTLTDGRFSPTEGLERDVTKHGGVLESFFLAETIKYFWLLFRDEGDGMEVDLTKWVFNTEAHPVRVRKYP